MPDSIKDILDNLSKLEEVCAVILISDSGEMMESAKTEEINLDSIVLLAHRCVTAGVKVGEILETSQLKSSFFEFERRNLTLEILKNKYILALLAYSKANLGRIRLELKRNTKLVEALL